MKSTPVSVIQPTAGAKINGEEQSGESAVAESETAPLVADNKEEQASIFSCRPVQIQNIGI